MKNTNLIRVKTITEFHRLRGLPKPAHPLISVADYSKMEYADIEKAALVFDFYTVSIKRNVYGKFRYGQQEYDFDEGIMFFTAPNQRLGFEATTAAQISGWILLIHPDFLYNTHLAKVIKQYEYFDYSVNEALFLSEKEEHTVYTFIENIHQEYHSNIDKFSKQIIISQIESLLTYSDRFYNRQFITREQANHQLLNRLDALLNDYFNGNLVSKGLPSVQFVAESLNVSPSYLSSSLRVLTGQNTQQHIHNRLIEKAKEKLSTTDLTVSEISYELGFEHLQSFSKLFKSKTNLSPLAFRQSFN